MIIWTTGTICVLLAMTGMALYFRWSRSRWLIDRRHALSKLDLLIEELGRFHERFPDLSERLHLGDLQQIWPAQRASIVDEGSFVAWIKAGRPRETCLDLESSALFSFARTKAGPLVWSMTQIALDPDADLLDRIQSVINRNTFELRFNPKQARRLVPAHRLSSV